MTNEILDLVNWEVDVIIRILFKNEPGHQAFVGSDKVRRTPPKQIGSFDYSSVAFLPACSEKRSFENLWSLTMAAVYLTFCFHIGGYPMKWCRETDLFFELPSASKRPDCIPASWLASCLLYHLQTIGINSFSVTELAGKEKFDEGRSRNHIGDG
ncbi:unnamed protein product [Rodentolepis nana]|uniref:Uncharacterized protein n=1 Tax=Rodentolepis nana TaxID=102285 RepID=A0A0R3TJ00_RODNA|nr:unnamed protein product [Rodentolepis nana]